MIRMIGLIAIDILVLAMIFLIAVYGWLDKKRFHLERQFRAVKPLADGWIREAEQLPACREAVMAYKGTKNISAKYRALAQAAREAAGADTAEMRRLAGELSVFLGVYRALAEEYNRRLNSRFTGKIAALLGFVKLPDIQMETTNV